MTFDADQYRALGSTGIHVSPLGLGTVKFGRNVGVKYPSGFSLPDDAALARLISVAKENGINLIDTAPAYGNSEERLGKLLRGKRSDWIICTKVGERFDNGASTWDFSDKATRTSIESSLQRLDTDVLDIVLVHCSDDDEHVLKHTDVMETLAKLKQEGKVRYIGASTKSTEGGFAALPLSDVVMVTYNVTDASQLPVLERAAAESKGVLVKKALLSGHTASADTALRFALGHPAVSSVIVGTIDERHLIANVAAVAAD
ncbi:MAG TPA: aldo/keto reductase [Pseudomonadales bacterium]|nr:aldo/keto reductase [Pseudomonadales bacterium]